LSFEPLKEHAFTEEKGMRDSRLEGIKIVAVDDDADSRDLLKAILQHSGADTTVVSSGQEALEAIAGSTVRIPNEASAIHWLA
jgi:PleD family two-component response regulator